MSEAVRVLYFMSQNGLNAGGYLKRDRLETCAESIRPSFRLALRRLGKLFRIRDQNQETSAKFSAECNREVNEVPSRPWGRLR